MLSVGLDLHKRYSQVGGRKGPSLCYTLWEKAGVNRVSVYFEGRIHEYTIDPQPFQATLGIATLRQIEK